MTTKLNPENIQKAVQKAAEEKRLEIKNLLTGNLISLSMDMATSMQRSFFGI